MHRPMPICLVLAAMIFLSSGAVAQSFGVGVQLPLSEVRVGSSFNASGGAGVAERGVASFHINPATFDAPGAYATIEGLWQKRPKWLADIDRLPDNVLPSRAAVVIPFDGFAVGIGYEQEIDDRLDIGPIPITTELSPEGTGQFMNFTAASHVRTAYVLGQASISSISIGILGGISRFEADESLFTSSMSGNGDGVVAGAGFIWALSENLTLGGAFRFHTEIDAKLTWRMSLNDSILTFGSPFAPVPLPPSRVNVQLPSYGQVGIAYRAMDELLLLGSVEYRKWYSFTSTDAKGAVNLHLGLRWTPTTTILVRTGFFTYKYPYNINESSLDQKFLAAGFEWTPISPVTLSISLLDSDVFAPDVSANSLFSRPYSQTEVTASLSIFPGR
jgi:hypothetical protein